MTHEKTKEVHRQTKIDLACSPKLFGLLERNYETGSRKTSITINKHVMNCNSEISTLGIVPRQLALRQFITK